MISRHTISEVIYQLIRSEGYSATKNHQSDITVYISYASTVATIAHICIDENSNVYLNVYKGITGRRINIDITDPNSFDQICDLLKITANHELELHYQQCSPTTLSATPSANS